MTIKKTKRKLGKFQKQATPLTIDILNQLINQCDETIKGLRNEILLRLGYESMRRRSEICRFRFEDVQVMKNNHYGIILRQSKTDQFGIGKMIPISIELYRLIQRWSGKINQDKGFILRSFKKDLSVNKSLNPASLNQILKTLQKNACLNSIGELSGHSFRVGAALDLLEQGVPLERIMLRGGWKSENTALRYLRNWDDRLLL